MNNLIREVAKLVEGDGKVGVDIDPSTASSAEKEHAVASRKEPREFEVSFSLDGDKKKGKTKAPSIQSAITKVVSKTVGIESINKIRGIQVTELESGISLKYSSYSRARLNK